jgi:hypothetical protein
VGLTPYRSPARARLWLNTLQFLLAAPIIACVLFVFVPMSLRDSADQQKLRAGGQRVTGVAEDLWEEPGRKGSVYQLRYRYTAPQPGGEPGSFTATEIIPLSLYQRLKPGAAVEVRYLPEKPQVARLSSMLPSSEPPAQNPLVWYLFWGGFALAACGIPLLMLRRVWPFYRREWRLERSGRLLAGEVVDFNPSVLRFGKACFQLRYRFLTPEGQLIEGETWGRHFQLFGQNPLPGTRVGIWYSDPQNYVVL